MTPEEIKALQKKMDEAADAMKHAQEKNDALEKKVDAVDFASMKDAQTASAQAFEDAQKERLAAEEENKERVEGLIKAVASLDGSQKSVDGLDPEHKKEMALYWRKGVLPSKDCVESMCEQAAEKSLIYGSDEKMADFRKALVEGSNADGGYFVNPDQSGNRIGREFETSPMRSVCTVISTTSDSVEMIIDDDEAAAGWVGEVEARAITDTPEIGKLTIPIHEMYAKPQATQRMVDDAGFDIEGWLGMKVKDYMTRLENTSYILGTGAAQPKGIMSYTAADVANTYQRDHVTQITATGTANTLDESNDLILLQNSVLDPYQAGAVFGGNRATFTDIMVMQDGEGQYLMNPMMMKQGTDRILLRKPFIIFADMADVATAALPLVYGDFRKGYTIADRFGIRVLRNPYCNPPYIQYYSTKRLGAAVTNYEAFHILVIN